MKKLISFLLMSHVFSNFCFAQTVNNNITIEVSNVVINGGTIFLAVFSSAETFRKEEPDYFFELNPNSTIISQRLSLPSGEYVVTAIQDANNNRQLDFNIFGIPKELFGITNFNGRGFPSKNFDRQKILINNTTRNVIIKLYRF